MKQALTVQEVADRYGVCERIVRRWIDSTWLPSEIDAAGTCRITEHGLQQFLNQTTLQRRNEVQK